MSCFIFIVLLCVLLYLLTISSSLLLYTFFGNRSHMFIDLTLQSFDKPLNNNKFSFTVNRVHFNEIATQLCLYY